MKIHENLNGWRLVAREMVKIMKNLGGKIMKNHYKRHENHESCREKSWGKNHEENHEKLWKKIMQHHEKRHEN